MALKKAILTDEDPARELAKSLEGLQTMLGFQQVLVSSALAAFKKLRPEIFPKIRVKKRTGGKGSASGERNSTGRSNRK